MTAGRIARSLVPALLLGVAVACSRRAHGPKAAVPLSGDSVWFSEGIGPGDDAVEETLTRFRCAAVFLPARVLARSSGGWSGSDFPAPARPLSLVPVVLVVSVPEDPLAGADEKSGKQFGAVLAREVEGALARQASFGPVRGVHLDLPFSGASARAHAAALTEARARLSHLLGRGGTAAGSAARALPLTISMRTRPPSEEKELKAVRALASRSDGIVAFLFGEDDEADPAFVDSLEKPWWAAYESAASGVVRRSTGKSETGIPERAFDALSDDPRIELVHELPWNEGRGSKLTLRAKRNVKVSGATLSAGDALVFSQPALGDLIAHFRADTSKRRFARGRIVIFGPSADPDRLFSVAALADVISGGRPAPELHASAAADGSRLVRVATENSSPHASVVSRVQNWVEVELTPARVSDVEPGGFDRWEAYDDRGRAVSPGRATRVRLYETFVAPSEKLEPARLRVRGRLPGSCCRVRTHVMAAAGEEISTEWKMPGTTEPAKPTSP